MERRNEKMTALAFSIILIISGCTRGPEMDSNPELAGIDSKPGSVFCVLKAGNRNRARTLLIDNPENIKSRDEQGRSPLMYVVTHSWADMVTELINKGADVNARDNQGLTALHWAAQHGHRPVIEQLIAQGADVNAQDAQGRTPLTYAFMAKRKHYTYGRSGTVELLIASGAAVDFSNGLSMNTENSL